MPDSLRALLARAGQMLRKSGPAPDSAFFLRLLEREGPLRTCLLRWLRLRVSPDALPRMRALPAKRLTNSRRLFSPACARSFSAPAPSTPSLSRRRCAP